MDTDVDDKFIKSLLLTTDTSLMISWLLYDTMLSSRLPQDVSYDDYQTALSELIVQNYAFYIIQNQSKDDIS